MIRDYRSDDCDEVRRIWLAASIEAHNFIDAAYWEARVEDMRTVYLPAAESRVLVHDGRIQGFYSLCENVLAALFVDPVFQGQGVGSALLDDALQHRAPLSLAVYKSNTKSARFYRSRGFLVVQEQGDPQTGQDEYLMRSS